MFVNHWPSRRGGQEESNWKRVRASRVLTAAVDSILLLDPKAKIVCMGDLNDYPDNESVLNVKSRLHPAIDPIDSKYGGTSSYRGEWNQLDYIFTSEGLNRRRKLRMVENSGTIGSWDFHIDTYRGDKVPFRTYGGKKYLAGYSDHLPVWIELKY